MGRKPIINDFFSEWNSNMAYVLGFWWADGNIARPVPNYRVEFVSKDKEHLELIAKTIGIDTPLSFRYGGYRLVFGRKQVWEDIQKHGGIPAKSLKATWPFVPSIFLKDFVRGYVDGDGSLYWNNVPLPEIPAISIVGTIPFLEGMALKIEKVTGIPAPRCYHYGKKVPFIRWTGLRAKVLAIWLYSDSTLYLKRKRDMAFKFFDWMPKRLHRTRKTITPKMRKHFKDLLPL